MVVDPDRYTGHDICESVADDVFEVLPDDGMLLIHGAGRPASDGQRRRRGVLQCAATALRIEQ